MRIPGIKLLRQNARWLKSRFRNRALILGYHRVADVEKDPLHLFVSPKNFAEQMEVIRQYTYPISMPDLVSRIGDNDLPRNAVAVTFDDGYADILYQALPILARYDVPATSFLVTGNLGRPFWWDEPASHSLSDVGDDDSRFERTLIGDEVLELASSELIEIGAHSVNHLMLADQPADEQKFEIKQSKVFLDELLGYPINGFSYPHGSVSSGTMEIVRNSGYKYACASHNDVVWVGTNRFKLPRFWIPNWGGKKFREWLYWWLN
jgi:peptidoglycan/xylan/chitin deacetylase (PgdA/CDA1 family)